MKNALLIVNPNAGSFSNLDLDEVKDKFKIKHIALSIVKTKRMGDGVSIAKKSVCKYDFVIAAGGDGTINEVINGIAQGKNTKACFGFIPLGTENLLAQVFGISLDNAVDVILKGKTKLIDLGKTKGRFFVLMAGIGFDAHIASVMEKKPLFKYLLGSGAYMLTAVDELFNYEPSEITVQSGKRKVKGYFVIVSNTKYYGGMIEVAPKASMINGVLDVCVFQNKDVFSMIKYAFSAPFGMHTSLSDVVYFKTKQTN